MRAIKVRVPVPPDGVSLQAAAARAPCALELWALAPAAAGVLRALWSLVAGAAAGFR